jgi:SAM-dependent methyltransferase
MLRDWGVAAVGIDPTEALLARARALDPSGEYRAGRAEALPFANEAFDLVVSYLTLIDIPDVERAVGEMARVLRPGGALLIANLNGFATTGRWVNDADGRRLHFALDRYLESRPERASWRGIDIVNWHRPLSFYMRILLGAGLLLRHFDEPAPVDDSAEACDYRRVPWHLLMEWEKPPA